MMPRLTKRMALEAKVPGATSIPDTAELFLGFTSNQADTIGPTVIANLETLPGVTNQWPDGYFLNGTTMHLSHIFEELAEWYEVRYRQRADTSFYPRASAGLEQGTQTIPEGPDQVRNLPQLEKEFERFRFIGQSSSMQPLSRLPEPVTDNYGTVWPATTSISQRADFNTLDNPFAFSADPQSDSTSFTPAAGVHFVIFMPTCSSFTRMRQAMDGQYPLRRGLRG